MRTASKIFVTKMLGSNVTVEDLAKAVASFDGQLTEFNAGKEHSCGSYLTTCQEVHDILRRANRFARMRDKDEQQN